MQDSRKYPQKYLKLKRLTTLNNDEDVKQLEQLYAAGECLNWYNLENHLSESPKGEQMYDKAIFPEKHTGLFKDTYRNIVVIFVIGKTGKSKIEFLKI